MLLHHVRLQPDAHGVGLRAEARGITHTLDTLQGWNQVDGVIVGQELIVVAAVRGQRVHENLRRLALHHAHTDLVYLGREQGLSLRHTVLHIHGTHIRIQPLTEHDLNHGRARRCRTGDIVHALHTVDALLKRRHNGILHRLGISSRIGSHHHNVRRCDIRILLDRKRDQSDEAQQYDKDRDYRREYRALNKICKSHNLPASLT